MANRRPLVISATTGVAAEEIGAADTLAVDALLVGGVAVQPLDATLTALAGANWAANALPIGTGADTLSQTTFAANTFPARASSGNLVAKAITDFGLSLVDDADAATARTTLSVPADADVVHKTGNESITGTKTFSTAIITASLTLDNGGGFWAAFQQSVQAANIVFTLPAGGGTFAMTSQLGTIASQNANNVAITGGTIDGLTNLRVGAAAQHYSSFAQAQVSSTGDGGLVIDSGAGNIGRLFFTEDGTDPNSGALVYRHATDVFEFFITGTSRFQLTSTGINSTAIGATTPSTGAFTTVAASSSILSSGATNGIGYATGAGGSVTQLTSKATGVTLNKACGWIVMHNAALAANTTVTFTLTNSAISANTDVVVVNYRGATAGAYSICVSDVAAGSCKISLRNESGGSLSEAVGVNFAVIKGVAS